MIGVLLLWFRQRGLTVFPIYSERVGTAESRTETAPIDHTEHMRYNSWLAQIIFRYVIAMSSTFSIERHVLDTLRCGGKEDFAICFVGMSEYW